MFPSVPTGNSVSLQDVLRGQKMIILKAGEHQITLTDEALEERVRRTEAAEFPHLSRGPGQHAGRGGRGGACPQPPARGLQAAFRQAQIHQLDRQGSSNWVPWGHLDPLTASSQDLKGLHLFFPQTPQHRSLWTCPCLSASSQTGQNSSTLPSQTHIWVHNGGLGLSMLPRAAGEAKPREGGQSSSSWGLCTSGSSPDISHILSPPRSPQLGSAEGALSAVTASPSSSRCRQFSWAIPQHSWQGSWLIQLPSCLRPWPGTVSTEKILD